MELRQYLRYTSFRGKIIYLAKSVFWLPQDGYFRVFWPAEQILFYKKFWFITQKMELRQWLRYTSYREKNIYLAKSVFWLPQAGYFTFFWPAEQILFYKKFSSISQKIDVQQNLRYRIFRVKVANIERSFYLEKFNLFLFPYS